ncbi:tetratricopeptide repeat protein [Nonomuraea mangrovi]|uniref:Tetratricopeptide repeat protein n=1 Tax=Nonomuraea mangrovi TaxID=2316207 RepID=A0ABW4TF52_9ACTN
MPRWSKFALSALVPPFFGAVVWAWGERAGMDLDRIGLLVGLLGGPLGLLAVWWTAPEPGSGPALGAGSWDVVGEVPRRPRAFQPRHGLRARLDATLGTGGAAVICSLTGARGVGKTQLAAAYARDRIAAGVPVAWLHAETPQQLNAGLDLMAERLGLRRPEDPAELARRVRTWLEARREPYLVVLDNAVDPDEAAALLPAFGAATVLITANNRAFERLAETVDVGPFTREEALGYLGERLGPLDREGASRLADELDRLPLALSIAAAGLAGSAGLSYDAYLTLLRETGVEQLLARPAGEPYPTGVAQAIVQSAARLSEGAASLLGTLAVLSAAGTELALLGPDAHGPLAELRAAALVTMSGADSTVVVAHRLVQRVVRERARADGSLVRHVHSAAALLTVVESVTREDVWRRMPLLLTVDEHAQALWSALRPDREPEAAERVLRIRYRVAYHLNQLGIGARAVPVWARLAEACELLLGADHADTLEARHGLATATMGAGRHEEAVKFYEALLADRERVQGPDHRRTLRTRHNLSLGYVRAGRPAEGIRRMRRDIADRARALGADHPWTLAARHNLGWALVEAERAPESLDWNAAVLADRTRVLGADHVDVLYTREDLARAHRMTGRAREAAEQLESLVEDWVRVVGAGHPLTLNSMHELAVTYETLGRDAAELYRRVLADREKVLGPDHPDTRRTAEALAR